MANILQTALGAREPMFTALMIQCEARTGNKGIDVQYIADIMTRAHDMMRKLRLDPGDTTFKELIATLFAAQHLHPQLFAHMDDVVVSVHGKLVSFNRSDIATFDVHNESVSHQYASCAIRDEIIRRYRQHGGITEKEIEAALVRAKSHACDSRVCKAHHRVRKAVKPQYKKEKVAV